VPPPEPSEQLRGRVRASLLRRSDSGIFGTQPRGNHLRTVIRLLIKVSATIRCSAMIRGRRAVPRGRGRELDAIEIASTHTIEIDRFVVPHDINRRFFDTP
jgi:hypothetical protein